LQTSNHQPFCHCQNPQQPRKHTQDKRAHAAAFERLRAVKADVVALQADLEAGRARLQRDFARWLEGGSGATAGAASTGAGAEGAAPSAEPSSSCSSSLPQLCAGPATAAPATTGDAAVDADVARFMAARAALLRTLDGGGDGRG
jgi:hypothetical protein